MILNKNKISLDITEILKVYCHTSCKHAYFKGYYIVFHYKNVSIIHGAEWVDINDCLNECKHSIYEINKQEFNKLKDIIKLNNYEITNNRSAS